jgi:cell division protein FtsA
MAASAAGVKVEAVYAGFPGHTVEFYIKKSSSLISKSKRVTQQDMERVKRLALVSDFPQGRRVIQAAPFEYMLDGVPVGGNPDGMTCSRLGVESLVVTADSDLLEKLTEAVHLAGARIIDWLPSTLAAGEMAVSSARGQVGVALVDLGESGTSVTIYNYGRPLAYEWLPVGGGHITSDLAICLRTTLEAAEGLKKEIGLEGAGSRDESITVPRLSGVGFNDIPPQSAVRVIEARTGEILDLVRSSIIRLTGACNLSGGIVLVGGGSHIRGLGDYASKYLEIAVEPFSPNSGGKDVFEKYPGLAASFTGALGLLKYFAREPNTLPLTRQQEDFWSKVKGLFKVSQ